MSLESVKVWNESTKGVRVSDPEIRGCRKEIFGFRLGRDHGLEKRWLGLDSREIRV
jgi:hypothetical protein